MAKFGTKVNVDTCLPNLHILPHHSFTNSVRIRLHVVSQGNHDYVDVALLETSPILGGLQAGEIKEKLFVVFLMKPEVPMGWCGIN